jgi:hypothetical protein
MVSSFELTGNCRNELDTEMRFLFASAKVDGEELIRLILPVTEDEKENSRINGCVIKVLRTLKKESVIQFYVNREGFVAASTEASFLLNKYGEFISDDISEPKIIFVKL